MSNNALDLIAAARQVSDGKKALAAYEEEFANCPEELPGGYFRALQSLQEWEAEVSRLSQQGEG